MSNGNNKNGEEKAERLAAALRANLKRRKAQARGDGAIAAAASDTPPSGAGSVD
jgi:hypothetical protein